MAISKLILNGEVQMDVTSDTVTAGSMLSGTTATKNDGTKATGTIASKSSSNLTVSGATVTAPAGYYASAASKSVASGTAGTPTASKGSVSNHTISVTPSVTNTTGYITGGTKTGTAVSVSASELVSGTKSITENGTDIDVTNYASVDVAVPSGPTYSVTITKAGSSGTCIKYNDTKYYGLDNVISVNNGEIIKVYVESGDNNYLYVNNVLVAGGSFQTVHGYDYTVTSDVEVSLTSDISTSSAYITELGGGGASNVVGGTYITGNGGSAETITLPYTGNGFPMQIVFSLAEGTQNSSGTAYNTIHQYGIVYFVYCKINTTAPTYAYDDSNTVSRYIVYKSSPTTANTLSGNAATMESYVFSPNSASSSVWGAVVQINSSTALSVYVSSASGTRGLMPNTAYNYSVVYSE